MPTAHSAPDNLALNLANPPTHETNRSHGTSVPVVSGSCGLSRRRDYKLCGLFFAASFLESLP